MKAIQLELDFRNAIALALAEPEVADLRLLWRSLEPELLGLTEKEQLLAGGQAFSDLAEVIHRRAKLMLGDWVDQHNTDGPIPDDDFLDGLVQKTMHLDISSLVKQPKSRRRAVATVEDEGESVAEEVSKVTALLLAGAEAEEEPLPIAVLEHDEDAVAWATVLREWMHSQGVDEVKFLELMNGVRLSMVKVWLALLLGDFDLRQDGGFYDGAGVAISLR
jgi:hypothetical protein